MKYFVSSDIHSAFTPWMEALNSAGFDINNPEHKIIVCGDLFDRMDETVKTYEFAKQMSDDDRLIYIRGNHEDLLFDCMKDIECGRIPDSHHFSNGTIKTICQFCGEKEWIVYDPTWRDKICHIMKPILDWINESAVNYAKIDKYVFVHGWIPVLKQDGYPYHYLRNRVFDFNPNWENATLEEWEQARWLNGMEMWSQPKHRLSDYTVVVGHWHCSFGWSHIDQKYKEFPDKSHKHFQYSFQPWVKDGIIALDSCVAYSGKINCIVIEDEFSEGSNE